MGDDLAAGRATRSYQFRFTTGYKSQATILQSYLGVIQDVGDGNQNLTQTFVVRRVDPRTSAEIDLGAGMTLLVPPNNQGIATPLYNIANNGERLSVFGGDALTSSVQPGLPGFPAGTIPGGWPNGRRFGDDVVDIVVTAVISDLRSDPLVINGPAGDGLDFNDAA